jgi:hypothetical protein
MASNYPSREIIPKGQKSKRKETDRAKRSHTKAEEAHLDRLASLGCILCLVKSGLFSPPQIHHVRTGTGAGRRSSHFDAIPLCPAHHETGPEALHVLGRKKFDRYHEITELELLAEVKKLLG